MHKFRGGRVSLLGSVQLDHPSEDSVTAQGGDELRSHLPSSDAPGGRAGPSAVLLLEAGPELSDPRLNSDVSFPSPSYDQNLCGP